ncbi:hypothetical protein [Sphingopyxis sp. 22461]|uniref:hypothetical protein n=1 Tax=Sphingopyxis sp. 22461 TaxID=3453923 RepID=UPI003F85074A
MNIVLRAAVIAFAAISSFTNAQAEVVHTIWEIAPPKGVAEVTAMKGKTFLEQRLIPIRMVRTTDAALDGQVPAGTPLYLVYNDAEQIGFCTVIDRSPGKAGKGLFIPAGNKRPCFTDRDNDGKFDATFQVFDLLTSPPKVGGSIANAQPMPSQVGFEEIDRHLYPENMLMLFKHSGTTPKHIRVNVSFENAGAKVYWQPYGSQQVGGKWVVFVLNSLLSIKEVNENTASFGFQTDPTLYIQRTRQGIDMIEMPAFLRRR